MARQSRDLRTLFGRLRREYFPRWDRAARWSAVQRETPGQNGFCDVAAKRIYVADLADAVTLVHEICHAVAGTDHGKRWRTRLRKAASDARRCGEETLAAELEAEAAGYEDARRVDTAAVYAEVGAAIRQRPDLSLDQIEVWVGRDHGMEVEDLRRRFRRLPRVVEEARRSGERRARLLATSRRKREG